jgi:hypothetical protein
MWAPFDQYGKRIVPWKPRDQQIILFDIQEKRVIETVPFASLEVYANGNRRYVLFYLEFTKWGIPENSYTGFRFIPSTHAPSWVPNEIKAMALLLS